MPTDQLPIKHDYFTHNFQNSTWPNFEVNPDPDPIPLTQTIPCIYQMNNAIPLTVNPDPVLRL